MVLGNTSAIDKFSTLRIYQNQLKKMKCIALGVLEKDKPVYHAVSLNVCVYRELGKQHIFYRDKC